MLSNCETHYSSLITKLLITICVLDYIIHIYLLHSVAEAVKFFFTKTSSRIRDTEILSHIPRCNVLWLQWQVLFNSLNDKVCANLISSRLPRYATAPPTEVNKAFYHINQQPVLKPVTVIQINIARSVVKTCDKGRSPIVWYTLCHYCLCHMWLFCLALGCENDDDAQKCFIVAK